MDITLDRLAPGTCAMVTGIACGPGLKHRLADFGLICGTRVRCRYESPRGDLKALELRSSVVAIRTADLSQIQAKVI